ncbi:MAG: transposase [Acetobacteraceae bacterium]|nr:transposase [Acetobacteraceae bacterium]MBV8522461.1 transposase [Acetobacteraceae bacterium]
MTRQRYTDEQIAGIIAEQQGGMKIADLCRKHGVSQSTFMNWKKARSGNGNGEPKAKAGRQQLPPATRAENGRIKLLKAENARLKRLLAEAVLDISVLRDAAAGRAGS